MRPEEPPLFEPEAATERTPLPATDSAIYSRSSRRRSKPQSELVAPLLPLEADVPAPTVAVVVAVGGAPLPQPLSYAVPPGLAPPPIGAAVLVPLRRREHVGFVVGPGTGEVAEPLELLEVLNPEPAFGEREYHLVQWIARRYHAPLDEVLRCIVPARHGTTVERVIRLTTRWRPGLEGSRRWNPAAITTATAIHGALAAAPSHELRLPELERRVAQANTADVLARLFRLGWIDETRRPRGPKSRPRMLLAAFTASAPDDADALSERQRRVLDRVACAGEQGAPLRELCRSLGVSVSVAQGLVRRGYLVLRGAPVARSRATAVATRSAPLLTPPQRTAAEAIVQSMEAGVPESFLLFGVTGSGKTEVYLRCFEAARAAGRPAIYLVPEISLTAQVAEQFRSRFGERVAVLHSKLSEGERYDEWHRIRRGQVDVIVGPRSALFAPCPSPAIVVLDEEHDPSYKQENLPRYWSPDVAAERARLAGSVRVLGSATPCVESFYAASQRRIRLLELPERILGRPMPSVEIADLRRELRSRPGTVFSEQLEAAVAERLARGEQVILFLNRRGFSAFILCRDCGYVAKCPNCNVSLVYHRQHVGRLVCHHCAYQRRAPDRCPRCSGSRIRHFGIGTERVESATRTLFPDACVARLDRDSTARKDSHTRIVNRFHNREIDILVGTQMVAKGFDFPAVTLVGVITADTALHLPDFRAGERTFQLLSQVSGRAGRGEQSGEVIVQTFQPDHFSIQAAARHDYRGFYEREIVERAELRYPPFSALARVVASDVISEGAEGKIHVVSQSLADAARERGVELLGPSEAPLARIDRKYRWHLLLKSPTDEALQDLLAEAWPGIARMGSGLTLDVDPQSLL